MLVSAEALATSDLKWLHLPLSFRSLSRRQPTTRLSMMTRFIYPAVTHSSDGHQLLYGVAASRRRSTRHSGLEITH